MTSTADLHVDRTQDRAETRIASYLLAEYLERLGVEVIFGLCGHTVIAFLDALRKSRIRFITARHEQVAAHAADGYARASGKPGVLLTHLGPGLTNAATGVANAALDSIPLVVIAGDVPSYYYGRHPHQEVNLHQDADQFQIFRPFCKRVYRVDRAEDLPRTIERAFHLAQTGRPGPVLVDVPMDFFSADLPVGAFHQLPTPMAPAALSPASMTRIVEALAQAERPLLYAGGGVISARATEELAASGGGTRGARRAQSHGQGLHAGGPSAAPGHDRLLGHAHRQREVPDGGLDPGRRHSAGGSELQLLGPALHVRHPAHPAHPHRRRPRGDRSELSDRARGRGRCQARAGRPLRSRPRPGAPKA